MIKNSFVSLAEQIMKMQQNSVEIISSLNRIVSSSQDNVSITTLDENDQEVTTSLPTIGAYQAEIELIKKSIETLGSVDQRGAIIQPARNQYKRIIVNDLNREPNPLGELGVINNFMSEKNHFFDALLNPALKVRIDLTDKIENDVRKILSRRYIINFTLDNEGNPDTQGQAAIDLFNENFKGRTDISIAELENFIRNTPGIRVNKTTNSKILFDEQEFDLEPNQLEFEGFFTILETDEDVQNRKLYYVLDTLEYIEVSTGARQFLQVGSELIINTDFSTTKYRVAEINREASQPRVLFERVEGFEPIPIGITNGMKFYSGTTTNKNVDITIGFNEYNVLFVKPINTSSNIIARNFSPGVAYFSNELSLTSNDNTGDNGKSMSDYYIETVNDFGVMLKDLVDRLIPRPLGIQPDAPELLDSNFRVIQANKYLTDTPDANENRQKHQQIRTLRSKLDENTKTIQQKRRELARRNFRNPKDKLDIQNQIKSLVEQSETDSQQLSTLVTELLANTQNRANVEASYKVQGFWPFPATKQDGKTRPQNVIAFRVQYKKSSTTGQVNNNEVFLIDDGNGNPVNAVFSPWEEYITPVRIRRYNPTEQTFEWIVPDISNIDEPNINSLNIDIKPTEQVEIRVKSISEVGYPDSILESPWSNILTIGFPDELLQTRNPQDAIVKNAELEDVRNRVQTDLDRLNLTEHLSDGVVIGNQYFPHITDNIGYKQDNGNIITLKDKIIQIENSDNVEAVKSIELQEPWANYSRSYNQAEFYKHEGRVYLRGLVRVDYGDTFNNPRQRFPNILVNAWRRNKNLIRIGRLPEGYRPSKRELFSTISSNSDLNARIDVTSSGYIYVIYGYTGWISMDGLSFRTDS